MSERRQSEDDDERIPAVRRPSARGEGAVALRISGEAEDSEAVLAFVDALFAHPRFDQPDLAREAERATGLVEFELGVVYRPAEREPAP